MTEDAFVGALDNPLADFAAHPDLIEQASRLTAEQLQQRRAQLESIRIVDVRGPGEIESGTIGGYPAWTNLHPTPNEKDSST